MRDKVSIKKILFFNWLLATVAGILVLLFQVISGKDAKSYYFALMGFIIVIITSNINLQFLKKILSQSSNVKIFSWYIVSFLFSTLLYFLLWPIFGHFAEIHWTFQSYKLFSILAFCSIIINAITLLMQRYLILQQEKLRTEIEISQLKAANAEALNLLLRQQIEPHFLFNALSNVKALYKENTERGEEYLMHLASFLRMTTSNHLDKIILLKDEIEFLDHYLQMQKIRFSESLRYKIRIPEDTLNCFHVPPYSLQLLVENAIKHNDFSNENPLFIEIVQVRSTIEVSNNIQRKIVGVESMGHGLANLRDRYALISGKDILIEEKKTTFVVTIPLLFT